MFTDNRLKKTLRRLNIEIVDQPIPPPPIPQKTLPALHLRYNPTVHDFPTFHRSFPPNPDNHDYQLTKFMTGFAKAGEDDESPISPSAPESLDDMVKVPLNL